jgi:oligopeptide transport system ATP-binding protein
MTAPPLLEVDRLTKLFGGARSLFGRPRSATAHAAVNDVSFTVAAGETLGIVGESGSGKSTTARLLLRLIEPTSGTVKLDGEPLGALSADELRRRRRAMQMVFQDPFASLNPRLTVGYQLAEPLRVHGLCSGRAVSDRVGALLSRVGLSPHHARAYPHQFSGGQRQRIAIARALAAEPKLIVADEAVSALDVSVRAQILNLIDDIRRESALSLVFISHDLGVVRHVADRVAVMFLGRIVEIGPVEAVFASPKHPYTRELLAAMPVPSPGRTREALRAIAGGETGVGCSFAARCPLATDQCRAAVPPLMPVAAGRSAACFRWAGVPPFTQDRGRRSEAAQARLRRLQDRFLQPAAGEMR